MNHEPSPSLYRRNWRLIAVLVVVLVAPLLIPADAAAQSPPTAVASVTLTRDDGTITATWDPVSGATKHHITYSTDGRASWSLAALEHPTNTITFNADNSKTYIVGVRPGNEAGWSHWVNSAPASPYQPPQQPPPQSPPAAVASVTLTRDDGTITATWDPVSGATKHHITYSTDGRASWSLAALEHPTNTITFNADNSKTYIVGVRPGNEAGWSHWVNSAPASPYQPPPNLNAADVTDTTATLTIGNWIAAWWYSHNHSGASCDAASAGTASVDVADLDAGTAYTYTAYSQAGCDNTSAGATASASASTQIGSTNFTTAQQSNVSLSVEFLYADGGRLTLTGYDGEWHYYEDLDGIDSNNVCKTVPAGTSTALINLTPGKQYRFQALSSLLGGCKQAGYSFQEHGRVIFTAPKLSASTTATTATLRLTSWSSPWYYQQMIGHTSVGGCQGPVAPVSGTGSATITGLRSGTTYDYAVYKSSSCHYSKVIAGVRTTTATPSLSISPRNPNSPDGWYRISLNNWDGGNWWIKETLTNTIGCTGVSNFKEVNLGTSGVVARYFRAYAKAGCSNADYMSGIEYKRVERDTLSVSNITGATAQLNLKLIDKDYPGRWYVKQVAPTSGPCSTGIDLSQPHNLSSLTPVTQYTYKAYTALNCRPYFERATVAFTTTEGLLVGDITSTTATLTIGGHTGAWWVKRTSPADTNCKSKGTTATEDLTSLTPGRSYTYTAYRDASCTNQIGSAISFTTLSLTTSNIAATKATLTLNQHSGNWWLKRTSPADANCTPVTASAASVTGLTPDQTYTYKAYSDASCTAELATETFTTLSMAAGGLTATTAALSLSNHNANWYYQANTGPDTSCQGPIGGSETADVAWLNPSTQYVYTAYRDSSCSDVLAAVTFTTLSGLGPKLATPTQVSITYTSTQLNVSWDAVTGATGYSVQSRVTTDDNSNSYSTPSAGTCASSVTGTSCTITGLTNGTSYDVQVRATRATNLPSDWSSSVTQAPSTLPGNPTSVSASGSKGGVSVTWTAPTDDGGSPITGAEIRTRTTTPQGSWSSAATPLGDATTSPARIIGLAVGTAVDVQLRVKNANGESGWVDAGSATPLATTAPVGKVQNVNVSYSAGKMWIRFDHPTDEGGLPLQFQFNSHHKNAGHTHYSRTINTQRGSEADKTHNGTTYDEAYFFTSITISAFVWGICEGANHRSFSPNILATNANGNSSTWYNHSPTYVTATC